jgi:AraC family transcriptional regulator
MTPPRARQNLRVQTPRFVDLLPRPPERSAACAPFELHVVEATPLHASTAFANHAIGLYTSGRHRIRREMGGRPVEGSSDRGAVNLTPAGVHATWEAEGTSRAIVFLVPDAYFLRLIEEDWDVDPRGVEIVPRFLTRDPIIEAVLVRLAMEVENGAPNGSLYCASACAFLARHLVQAHSSMSKAPPRASGGLSLRRLKIVVDYIEANLGSPLTLQDLATLAGVSARHFERAFRKSVGSPPHAFVLRKRVYAARDLLVNRPTLTIAEIAHQVGFASSSHLATMFRRQVGCAPAAFRRLNG